MTVRNPISERLGAVKADVKLEQREMDFVRRKESALDIVEGRHRRLCIQELADSGKQGAERASGPIWMTAIEAPGFPLVTHRELLKLS